MEVRKVGTYFGYTSLTGITITIASIAISWWALQSLRLDIFLKKPKSGQGIALQIILAIVVGYQLAMFLLDYLSWSYNLKNLF